MWTPRDLEQPRMRVLVVEDEMIIAMMIEDMLLEMGHDVIGVVMRLPQAIEAATGLMFDLALLDVNLDGDRSFPVADILLERKIPFIFATGYGRTGVESLYGEAPIVSKPFTPEDLLRAMDQATARTLRGSTRGR